jgi:hypothetical protein
LSILLFVPEIAGNKKKRFSHFLMLTLDAIIACISDMMEPANTIILKCGGVKAVAAMTGRSEVRVRRWGYPKSRGGTDGLIPSDVQQILLREARTAGLPIEPSDFFLDYNSNQETSHAQSSSDTASDAA